MSNRSHHRPLSVHRAVITALLALLLLPAALAAQVARHAVSKTMLGEAVVILNARADDLIEVAAADGRRSIALTLGLRDATHWADSSAKILRFRVRKRPGTVSYRNLVEEPGVSGGGISLTRRVTAGESEYSVFFADTSFGGFAVPMSKEEATLFVSSVRKAVAAARKLSPREPAPAPRKKRTPRAKTP